jgi:hypothetical protein
MLVGVFGLHVVGYLCDAVYEYPLIIFVADTLEVNGG